MVQVYTHQAGKFSLDDYSIVISNGNTKEISFLHFWVETGDMGKDKGVEKYHQLISKGYKNQIN